MRNLFKKYCKILTFLFLFTNVLTFSNNLDYSDRIIMQRSGVITGIQEIKKGPRIEIFADVITADEFLRQIVKQDVHTIERINLFFPDIGYLNDYIEDVSKRVKEINVYLFDIPNDNKYMKNRDYVNYELKKVDKKISKLKNIKVYKIGVPEREIVDIFLESLNKKVIDSQYYNTYIKGVK